MSNFHTAPQQTAREREESGHGGRGPRETEAPKPSRHQQSKTAPHEQTNNKTRARGAQKGQCERTYVDVPIVHTADSKLMQAFLVVPSDSLATLIQGYGQGLGRAGHYVGFKPMGPVRVVLESARSHHPITRGNHTRRVEARCHCVPTQLANRLQRPAGMVNLLICCIDDRNIDICSLIGLFFSRTGLLQSPTTWFSDTTFQEQWRTLDFLSGTLRRNLP